MAKRYAAKLRMFTGDGRIDTWNKIEAYNQRGTINEQDWHSDDELF